MRPHVEQVVAELLDTLIRELPVDGTKQSKGWRWWLLIDPLIQAGFKLTGTAQAVKRQAVAQHSLDSYELLCKLHDGYPSLFDEGEWEQVRGGFAAWTRESLKQPSAWFDEVDELVRLSAIAREMAIELDEAAWTGAREEVSQSPWERQTLEMELGVERRDLEWAAEPRPRRESLDEEQIDTLFRRLQE